MVLELNKLNVLVIEDTIPMRKLIENVLRATGVGHVYAAHDGVEGLKLFKNEKPDIVIVDWHMEPLDGIEIVRQIRTHPNSHDKKIPIIMITGYSALSRVATARDAGVTEFLIKPFSASALVRRIAYVVNNPRDFIRTDDYFGPDRRRKDIANYTGPQRRSTDFETTDNDHKDNQDSNDDEDFFEIDF